MVLRLLVGRLQRAFSAIGLMTSRTFHDSASDDRFGARRTAGMGPVQSFSIKISRLSSTLLNGQEQSSGHAAQPTLGVVGRCEMSNNTDAVIDLHLDASFRMADKQASCVTAPQSTAC